MGLGINFASNLIAFKFLILIDEIFPLHLRPFPFVTIISSSIFFLKTFTICLASSSEKRISSVDFSNLLLKKYSLD